VEWGQYRGSHKHWAQPHCTGSTGQTLKIKLKIRDHHNQRSGQHNTLKDLNHLSFTRNDMIYDMI
jgi:hypothetical protein